MDKIFADGLRYYAPPDNAPLFLKGKLSFNVETFKKFLDANNTNSGYVNVDIKESKGGKLYCELNTFKRDAPNLEKKSTTVSANDPVDDIPF